MTQRFLFPARTVTKNPSVWIRHLNYFLHRASFTIYLQYTEFHVLSCYLTLTWNILETWKPAWLYGFRTGCYRRSEDSTASLNTRRCISCSFLNTMDSTKNYGLLSCSSLPSLGQASTGGCWVRFCMTSRRKCILFFTNIFVLGVILTSWTVTTFHNNSKDYYS